MSFQYVSKKVFQLVSSCQSFKRLKREARVGINSSSSCMALADGFKCWMLIRQEPGISFKKSEIFFPATSCNAGSPAPGFGRSKELQKFLKDQASLARISIMRSGFGNATHQRSTSKSVMNFSSKTPAFEPLPETRPIPSRTEFCARMLTGPVGCKATWRRQGDRRKKGPLRQESAAASFQNTVRNTLGPPVFTGISPLLAESSTPAATVRK